MIDVDNSDKTLMAGMTADLTVGVTSAHDVPRVPNLALRFQPPADLVDSSKIQQCAKRPSGAGVDRVTPMPRGPWRSIVATR